MLPICVRLYFIRSSSILVIINVSDTKTVLLMALAVMTFAVMTFAVMTLLLLLHCYQARAIFYRWIESFVFKKTNLIYEIIKFFKFIINNYNKSVALLMYQVYQQLY